MKSRSRRSTRAVLPSFGALRRDNAPTGRKKMAGEWRWDGPLMTHKCRVSIIVLSISKSVEPNEEQKEMISGFQ